MGNSFVYNVQEANNGSSLYTTYINLAHRTDRQKEIEDELHRIGLHEFQRFNAIKHKKGAIGCFLSHFAALQQGIDSGKDHILILEDDFQMLVSPVELHELLQTLTHVDYDVFLMSPTYYSKSCVKETSHHLLLKNTKSDNTGGYIVNKKYAATLLKHYEIGIKLLQLYSVYNFHVDVFANILKKRDRWFCYHKPFGKQRDGFSDIDQTNKTF